MSEENKNIINIRACRICLQANFSNGVTVDSDDVLLQMYNFCFGVTMTSEDNPKKLCGVCLDKLKEFSEFKNNALRSEKLWKSMISISIECSKMKSENDENDYKSDNELVDDSTFYHYDNSMNDSTMLKEVDRSPSLMSIDYEILSNMKFDSEDIKDKDVTANLKCPKEENEPNDTIIYNYKSSCIHPFDATVIHKKKRAKYKINKNKAKSQGDNENFVRNQVTTKRHYKKRVYQITNKSKPVSPTHDCGLCDKIFTESKKLQQHLNEHSTQNDLCCKQCGFTGRDFADMVPHRYDHFSKKYKIDLECHSCNKKIKNKLKLQFHYRAVHLNQKGGLCSVCNKQYKDYTAWRNHERFHVIQRFICDICGRRFLFRHSIIEHLANHSEYKGYVCDICGRQFKRESNLRGHIQTRHVTNKVKCTLCNKIFKHQKSLENHLKEVHDEKPYQCEVCSKRYNSSSTLKRHMIWHSDHRPFACSTCGATFKAKGTLNAHSNTHSGILPHKCPDCFRCFRTGRQLRIHSSVHTGVRCHKCTHCPRSFHTKKLLLQHCDKLHNTEEDLLKK